MIDFNLPKKLTNWSLEIPFYDRFCLVLLCESFTLVDRFEYFFGNIAIGIWWAPLGIEIRFEPILEDLPESRTEKLALRKSCWFFSPQIYVVWILNFADDFTLFWI